MRLIMNAGHEFEVYGKVMRAGDEFEVPDNEAAVWLKLGRARRAEQERKRGRYARADMRAEDD